MTTFDPFLPLAEPRACTHTGASFVDPYHDPKHPRKPIRHVRRQLCPGRVPIPLCRCGAGQPCRGRLRRAECGQPFAVDQEAAEARALLRPARVPGRGGRGRSDCGRCRTSGRGHGAGGGSCTIHPRARLSFALAGVDPGLTSSIASVAAGVSRLRYLWNQPTIARTAAAALKKNAIAMIVAAEFVRLESFSVGGFSSGFRTIFHHPMAATTRNRTPKSPTT